MNEPNEPTPIRQMRLFDLAPIDNAHFFDPLVGWDLTDVRALAVDPDVEVRRTAALSNWNLDARLQRVLATDPDQTVVLLLLTRIDPPLDVAYSILNGPHVQARRVVATRNLPNRLLLDLTGDYDPEVARAAASTLRRRGLVTVRTGTPQ